MTCDYATQLSAHVNSCGLGLHGGQPSRGVCARCVERGENNEEFAASYKANTATVTPPTLPQMAGSLAGSVASWAKGGFQVADEATLASRMEICRACPEWDSTGFGGTGRCRKCGCSTAAKLRMATSKCPDGKW